MDKPHGMEGGSAQEGAAAVLVSRGARQVKEFDENGCAAGRVGHHKHVDGRTDSAAGGGSPAPEERGQGEAVGGGGG